jgi:diamine N-acetyltransferase
MEIAIQKITLKDAPILAAMARQTFYDTFTGTCTEEDMKEFLELYYNEATIAAEIADDSLKYYFAIVNELPVGYILFQENDGVFKEFENKKCIELRRLYVLKEFHSKGVAQKLMDYFMEYVHTNNYEALFLGVWEFNYRAQKFYGKYGFTNSGYTHDFPIGSTPQTDFWLWKFL